MLFYQHMLLYKTVLRRQSGRISRSKLSPKTNICSHTNTHVTNKFPPLNRITMYDKLCVKGFGGDVEVPK